MARHKHFEIQLPNDWRESFKKIIEWLPPSSRKQGLRVIQSPHTEKAYQYLLGESSKVFLTDDAIQGTVEAIVYAAITPGSLVFNDKLPDRDVAAKLSRHARSLAEELSGLIPFEGKESFHKTEWDKKVIEVFIVGSGMSLYHSVAGSRKDAGEPPPPELSNATILDSLNLVADYFDLLAQPRRRKPDLFMRDFRLALEELLRNKIGSPCYPAIALLEAAVFGVKVKSSATMKRTILRDRKEV